MFTVYMVPSEPYWFLGLEAIELCERLRIAHDSSIRFTRSCHDRLSLSFARQFESEFRDARCVMFKYDISDLMANDVVSLPRLDETEICLRDNLPESRLIELIEAWRCRHTPGRAQIITQQRILLDVD
jgi:hypothetical protein